MRVCHVDTPSFEIISDYSLSESYLITAILIDCLPTLTMNELSAGIAILIEALPLLSAFSSAPFIPKM